jgi:hypothetical protein
MDWFVGVFSFLFLLDKKEKKNLSQKRQQPATEKGRVPEYCPRDLKRNRTD